MTDTGQGVTVQEAAKALGVRCHSIYGLLRDGILAGTKLESGEWRVDPESISVYALRRSFRHASPRSVRRRSVIDVGAMRRPDR